MGIHLSLIDFDEFPAEKYINEFYRNQCWKQQYQIWSF